MTKTSKVSKKTEDTTKHTLIGLVEESTVKYTQIILNLSKEGLLKQLEEEQRLRMYGLPIEPSITQEEFNKIVEA